MRQTFLKFGIAASASVFAAALTLLLLDVVIPPVAYLPFIVAAPIVGRIGGRAAAMLPAAAGAALAWSHSPLPDMVSSGAAASLATFTLLLILSMLSSIRSAQEDAHLPRQATPLGAQPTAPRNTSPSPANDELYLQPGVISARSADATSTESELTPLGTTETSEFALPPGHLTVAADLQLGAMLPGPSEKSKVTAPVKSDDDETGNVSPAATATEAVVEESPEPSSLKEQKHFALSCFVCQTTFNAYEAEWCSCLVRERSLVCTTCGRCSCRAPASYKHRLWMNAPADLIEARPQPSLSPSEPQRDEVRPLVLVVEDEKDMLAFVTNVVRSLGYGLIVARDGEEGLTMAKKHRPDLVVSDALLPKMDGREMCRLIKADGSLSHVRTIVLTGVYTYNKYKPEAIAAFQVDAYLFKPINLEELKRTLNRYLQPAAS